MNIKRKVSLVMCAAMALALISGCSGPDGMNPARNKAITEILKDSTFYFLDETDALEPYYQMAAERKEAILNSPTQIVKAEEFIPGETYTGTAYYVSPNGSDENDGLSPDTAWKSAHRANWGDVHEGDAVFFERGGIYPITEEPIRAVSNVTYSAYGEGAKPVITLAQENSARSECWELWYEGPNGEKIWRYCQQVGETGGIIFDDTSYAQRIYEWPTPEGWLALDVQVMDPANGVAAPEDPCGKYQAASANEYRTVEEQLINDLTYICRVDITDLSYPIDFCYGEYRTGELYLRCDKGNPGEFFEEIAVISLQKTEHGDGYGSIIDGYNAGGWVLDNLSLKYYLVNAVATNFLTGKDIVIQNCTVEWGGNTLFDIQSEEPTNSYMLIGDGIYCVANNATIRNNYMRHCGNACTFENSMETPEHMGTYTAEGNLMENCGQGIRTYFIEPESEGAYDETVLRDNIILDTGNGLNNACWEEPVAIDLGHELLQYAKHIEVSNNVLIGSTLAMFRIPDSTGIELDIHDNVIAQSGDGALITECVWSSAGTPKWHMMKDAKE